MSAADRSQPIRHKVRGHAANWLAIVGRRHYLHAHQPAFAGCGCPSCAYSRQMRLQARATVGCVHDFEERASYWGQCVTWVHPCPDQTHGEDRPRAVRDSHRIPTFVVLSLCHTLRGVIMQTCALGRRWWRRRDRIWPPVY